MTPLAVLLGGTLLFGLTAAGTLGAIRLCLGHPRGTAVLLIVGALTATMVGLLWYDGRISRYFAAELWLVVAVAPGVGAAAARDRRTAVFGIGLYIGLFVAVFALRLPLDVSVGSAAAIGFVIETVTVAFVGFPAAVSGAVIRQVARKHLSARESR